jgi:hypothetical protein
LVKNRKKCANVIKVWPLIGIPRYLFDKSISWLITLYFFRRRCTDLSEKGILYVGSGVSGGEEGARYGPSIMPGGNPEAWPHIKPIFQVHMYLILILDLRISNKRGLGIGKG